MIVLYVRQKILFMSYAPEVKKTLFVVFVGMLVIAFLVTILGIIGVVSVPEKYLDKMFYALIVEIIGVGIAIFRKGEFLKDSGIEKDLKKYKPSPDAHKLLATLWKYQLSHSGKDMNNRWLMGLPPTTSGASYPAFYRGLAELLEVGLAEINRPKLMAMLSNDAFAYCSPISNSLTSSETYHFEPDEIVQRRIRDKLAEPDDADNPCNPPENPKNQLDD